MNVIRDLGELAPTACRAVIINCGTRWVSSLALLSALRHARVPVLVIDCESRDGSEAHFRALAERHRLAFDWLAWPLRPHPAALDRLFADIADESVLLVDSDLEIRADELVDAMRRALAEDPAAYGAGFVHGPMWLGAEHGLPASTGWYVERMWIPCVLLRTAHVREALAAGHGFANRREFARSRGARWLTHAMGLRFRLRGFRRLRLPGSRRAEPDGSVQPGDDGVEPVFTEYDTGADLHRVLLARGHPFARLPAPMWGDVRHFHGVTRAFRRGVLHRLAQALHLASRETETRAEAIENEVKTRLVDAYGVDLAGLDAAARGR